MIVIATETGNRATTRDLGPPALINSIMSQFFFFFYHSPNGWVDAAAITLHQ